MHDLPPALRSALDDAVRAADAARVVARARRIIELYQSDRFEDAGSPVLADPEAVLAYAVYRMPATYAAVRGSLGHTAARLVGWSPTTHLDLGGGTGSAAWAAHDLWPTVATTVLEQAGPAMDLGRRLLGGGPDGRPAVRWQHADLTAPTTLPEADLVTISYVLGELPTTARGPLVRRAAAAARGVLLVVEPGSRAGHRRVMEVRETLQESGFRTLAPCPHERACPLLDGDDWCHMAERVNRSAAHRAAKGGSLGYEDEKLSYAALVAPGMESPWVRPHGRVVRRPVLPKGRVELTVCTTGAQEPVVARQVITKREKDVHRAARNTAWGDPWPPQADG